MPSMVILTGSPPEGAVAGEYCHVHRSDLYLYIGAVLDQRNVGDGAVHACTMEVHQEIGQVQGVTLDEAVVDDNVGERTIGQDVQCGEVDRVGADTARQDVLAAAAVQRVVADAAEQEVVSGVVDCQTTN